MPQSPSRTRNQNKPIRFGMVAGEMSGDILGSDLIQSLKQRYPDAIFEGIGGPLMLQQGFNSFVPMERLSVMGLVEVLGRLFELILIRWRIRRYFIQHPPDVFIGIDAPDFTIGLELALRKAGIKTVHYVSPSVWAWRQKRVFKIARAVDLMLTLLPFEAKFYKDHQVPVRFVGHPLADIIPMENSGVSARQALVKQDSSLNSLILTHQHPVVALLPGSRGGEIQYIGATFIKAARWLHARRPDLVFLLPYVNDERKRQIEALIKEECEQQEGAQQGVQKGAQKEKHLPITLVKGHSRDVMSAADVVLLASGTATLEAMLLKRPMVVAYKVSKITSMIMKRLLKAPFVSLPNLLAGRELVPELLQDAASPEALGQAVLERLDGQRSKAIQQQFSELHESIQCNASETAADAIVQLLGKNVQKP